MRTSTCNRLVFQSNCVFLDGVKYRVVIVYDQTKAALVMTLTPLESVRAPEPV